MILSATVSPVSMMQRFPNRGEHAFAEHPFDVVAVDARHRPFLGRHELHDPFGGRHAAPQHGRFDRLGEIVVGAGVEAGDHVFLGVAAGEHHDVGEGVIRVALHAAADVDAVHARHLPIENRQPRRVVPLQDVPRLSRRLRPPPAHVPRFRHSA